MPLELKYKEDLGKPKQFNPNFSGPISKRRPRDICCLLLFIIFWVIVFAIFGFRVVNPSTRGDPRRVFQPMDSYGRFCGFDASQQVETAITWEQITKIRNLADTTGADTDFPTKYASYTVDMDNAILDMTDFDSLWFPATTLSLDDCVCVRSCPDFSMPNGLDEIDLTDLSLFGCVCHPDFEYLTNQTTSSFAHGDCGSLGSGSYGDLYDKLCYHVVYDSVSSIVLANRCWPSDITSIKSEEIKNTIYELFDDSSISSLFMDLPNSWYFILIGLGIAVALSFVWLVVMRFFAKLLIWATIWALFLILIVFAAFATYQAYNTYTVYSDLSNPPSAATRRLVIAIALAAVPWVAMLVFIALLCFFSPRINLALAIIVEASKAIASMPTIVFYPFIFLGLAVICLAFVGVTILYALSAVEMTSFSGHRDWNLNYYDYAILGLLTFFFYWVSFFIMGVCQTVIAGAIAQFYWRRDKNKIYWLDIPRAVVRTILFHLGSIAFGSFLIATIAWARFVLNYVKKRVKAMNTPPAKTLMRVINCLMYIFERILKYITRMAYIEIAVYGYSFCTAAKRAVQQLLRNVARVAAINVIGDSLLILGKVFVAVTSGLVVAILVYFISPTGSSGGFIAPMLITGVVGYLFSHLFMVVYEMAIDTTFMCFVEDVEKNNGTPARPYWCGNNLRAHITKSDRAGI
ncbi:Choline transporter-like [Carpediemonas membranifera]|uniref:Choline transporter-like protein n=1 Tax=Carpediemonas membranifera TaxID=201153 RepID=A0A8J6EA71_9EUKA|nr:Choline transporter-like [Carpediemonas membranifera]|eukprot:KAG9394300.1 Choline transporter-like [Carpediemonas membranifera]